MSERLFRVWVFGVSMILALLGCSGVDGGGTGGDGDTGSSGTGGSATTVTTTTTGSGGSETTTTSGTGGSVAPTCGVSVPKACKYPNDALGFDPNDGAGIGPVFPYPGEAELGASASCVGPFDADRTFTRAVVLFTGAVPESIDLDAWTQDGRDPGERVPAWTPRTLVDEDSVTNMGAGKYAIDLTVPAGKVACVGAPLSQYVPQAMSTGACFEPRRTWWYGLPFVDGVPSWAMLECPESEEIAPYGFDLSYGFE